VGHENRKSLEYIGCRGNFFVRFSTDEKSSLRSLEPIMVESLYSDFCLSNPGSISSTG